MRELKMKVNSTFYHNTMFSGKKLKKNSQNVDYSIKISLHDINNALNLKVVNSLNNI
jgi:hypothetical protein